MAVPLSLGPVHHLRLTVTDVERSRAFYTELLGFQVAMDAPPPAGDPYHDLTEDILQDGIVMANGDLLVGLRPVDAERSGDRFDPFRCGLDHLSFRVPAKADLVAAVAEAAAVWHLGQGLRRYTRPMTSAQRSGLDAAERSGLPGPPAKGLRRDAQRNRDAIGAAAREVFSGQGLEAPLEEIARRAGVGIGTLYRRFPTRVDLVDAVLAGRLRAHVDAAEQALRIGDPWDGFAFYLEQTCQLEASDRGVGDVMSMRFPRATAVETAKARLFELVRELVRRAQASGQLRADLTLEDLAFLNWSNAKIVEATGAVAPDAWRRHLAFLLDAFRADRAHELPEPSLTPRQVYRAMLSLGVRCARSAQ